MATLQFDLVSPERKLASAEADQIEIPGADGDFTAMANHASTITTLRPGVLRVTSGSDVTEYIVTGGFVEISATSASVLAEQAFPKSEATADMINDMVASAEAALDTIEAEHKDVGEKLIADTKALLDLI